MSTTALNCRELAHRVNDGIEVSLFWEKVGDVLSLEVYDARTEEHFAIEVPRDRALEAFRHPYAYIAASTAEELGEALAA